MSRGLSSVKNILPNFHLCIFEPPQPIFNHFLCSRHPLLTITITFLFSSVNFSYVFVLWIFLKKSNFIIDLKNMHWQLNTWKKTLLVTQRCQKHIFGVFVVFFTIFWCFFFENLSKDRVKNWVATHQNESSQMGKKKHKYFD